VSAEEAAGAVAVPSFAEITDGSDSVVLTWGLTHTPRATAATKLNVNAEALPSDMVSLLVVSICL
jgi:hypothetical protein